MRSTAASGQRWPSIYQGDRTTRSRTISTRACSRVPYSRLQADSRAQSFGQAVPTKRAKQEGKERQRQHQQHRSGSELRRRRQPQDVPRRDGDGSAGSFRSLRTRRQLVSHVEEQERARAAATAVKLCALVCVDISCVGRRQLQRRSRRAFHSIQRQWAAVFAVFLAQVVHRAPDAAQPRATRPDQGTH